METNGEHSIASRQQERVQMEGLLGSFTWINPQCVSAGPSVPPTVQFTQMIC